MEKRIIDILKTKTEPATFAEITAEIRNGESHIDVMAISKAIKRMLNRNRLIRIHLGYRETKFSGIAKLPLWGYQLPTNSARKS